MSAGTRAVNSTKKLLAETLVLLTLLSTGCAKTGEFTAVSALTPPQNSGLATPDPAPSSSTYKLAPLAWESPKFPERSTWSQHLHNIILEDWNTLLPGADDITNFCPRYHRLNNDERANVWAQLFAAMAKYESSYSPVTRMHETTMGIDPVTGLPVYSEGLLQLSYQDIRWAPWCKFDWSQDRNLEASHPRKTILNPFLNLDCGVGIMAKQIKSKGAIVIGSGAYWAVLKSGGRYQKISSIQEMVRSLPLCK